MVVARRDVGRERAQRIEGRFLAGLQLFLHVDLDHVHGHVARAFDHDLDVVPPGDLGQFAQRLQFGKLRLIVGVGNGARAQPVAQTERHVVGLHDLADLFEVGIGEVFLMMRQAPLRMDRSAAGHDAGHAFGGHRHIGEAHTGMDGEVVDALFGLLDQRVAIDLPGQVFGLAVRLFRAPDRSAPCRWAPANCG